MSVVIADLKVGEKIGRRSLNVNRQTLVRYAGASEDYNPIHFADYYALGNGLPDVIAHGMLTMGSVIEVVVDWLGDPSRIRDYSVRFTKPIVVPGNDQGTNIEVVAVVGAVNAEAGTARIDLLVTHRGTKVLTKAQVLVS